MAEPLSTVAHTVVIPSILTAARRRTVRITGAAHPRVGAVRAPRACLRILPVTFPTMVSRTRDALVIASRERVHKIRTHLSLGDLVASYVVSPSEVDSVLMNYDVPINGTLLQP